jgi:beta-lactamase regulating signal transducer with metallopeptidase domain
MNAASYVDAEVCSRIFLTLVHSLWEVAAVVGMAWVVGRQFEKRNVEWSYVVHVGALVLSLMVVLMTFLIADFGSDRRVLSQTMSIPGAANAGAARDEQSSLPHPARFDTKQTDSASDQVANGRSPLPPSPVAEHTVSSRYLVKWLVVLYAMGVGGMLVRLVLGVAAVERTARRATVLHDGAAVAALAGIVRKWKLRAMPTLAAAQRIATPMVVGLIRPLIVLPTSALSGLSVAELELILAHELAHIVRRDLWVNLLQRLVEAILFFNPAMWYLSRRIGELREYCCDELACQMATRTANTRTDYAVALLRVGELSTNSPHTPIAALAVHNGSPSTLRRRIARLFGEEERLRISRGPLALAICIFAMLVGASAWMRIDAREEGAAKPQVGNYPPPLTDMDQKVAKAREGTFGLEHVPRLTIRQTFWNGTVLSMRNESEASLKLLWQARGRAVDDTMRRNTKSAVTVAWDKGQLLMDTDTDRPAEGSAPASHYVQSRFWNGTDGWLCETSSQGRSVYRYRSLDKLTENSFFAIYFPQADGGGGCLPWDGPRIVLDQIWVDPQLTRYKRAGSEVIDDVECEIYDGPARQEKIWIEKSTGLLKVVGRYFTHDTLPTYCTDLIREVAGRTFANDAEYRAWHKMQSTELQAKLAAHWAAAHWPSSRPANLTIYSAYREIAPGVRWPMHSERIAVLPHGRDKSSGCEYFRSEADVTDVRRDFSIGELAKDTLPHDGDRVVDRRYDPAVEYNWSKGTVDREIETLSKQKLAEREKKKADERRINETPINSIDDALQVLSEGPNVDPCNVWARAIKYLVDHKAEAFEPVVQKLDAEKRDHPISKLAFTLRAIGDRRAVPALIRALPKTLLPSRSDYGLKLDDPALSSFMQRNDTLGKLREGSDMFDYSQAFRELTSALERLTGKDFGEMELNWVHLSSSELQRQQQRAQFYRFARRWADWWEANWKSMVDEEAYSKVKLPPLEIVTEAVKRDQPPSGAAVKLESGYSGFTMRSVQESNVGSFLDLDTMREGGWPTSLPPMEKIGVDSPELSAWARHEGFDLVCMSYTPPGETQPLYCLKPLGMRVWKITRDELRELPKAMTGNIPYPLSRPVELMIPQREVKLPFDNFSGDSFLYVTSEGTAGVVRMTAQVTDTDYGGGAYSGNQEFSSSGYYRGAKVSLSTIVER